MTRSDPLRITLSGYYGFQNTGDEAVLAGIAESFRERAGEGMVRLIPLSADPDDTRRRHGLDSVHRMRLKDVRLAIADSDLFLSGGGSLLQDTTSLRSVLYYLWIVRLAMAARKPVMFYAQGIGPLRRAPARFLTRTVADRVSQITVRDAESAQLLREIGVTRPPVEITADPAFALSPCAEESSERILIEAGMAGGQPLVGIAPRPWHGGRPTVEEYASLARSIHKSHGARIVLLPMQPPGDLDLCEQIAAATGPEAAVVRNPIAPPEMIGLIARLDAIIAMRLHALIFAASVATPIVAFSYDPKVRSLMSALGQPARCLDAASFQLSEARLMTDSALANGESTRVDLRGRAYSFRGLALRNADLALKLARAFSPV